MNQSIQKYINKLVVLFIGAIISALVALQNLFPLVYSDTGSYIRSGFDGWVPFDRSIFYGLMIRHISLGDFPWLVIAVQSILIAYLLYKLTGLFYSGLKRNLIYLSFITFITFCTGYSYTVSILIPDIFTPISILCVILLLFDKKLHLIEQFFIGFIFIFSICAHLANLPIYLLFLGTLWIIYLFQNWRKNETLLKAKKLLLCTVLMIASWILVPSVHYSYDGKFKTSKGSHAFILNHFIETGILEDYLKNECSSGNYRLCEYKDQIGWNFLWDTENSPMYKMGGWEATEGEYRRIIKDICLDPDYWPDLIIHTTEYTFKQFFTFYTTVSPPLLKGSAPFGQIRAQYPNYERSYILSLQSRGMINLVLHNQIQNVVIILSMLVLVVVLLFKKIRQLLNLQLVYINASIFLFSLFNSMVCSNLSTIDPRYQNRLVWLFPVLVVFIAISLYKSKGSLIEILKK